jgi:site-specific recombinase XerD
MKTTETNAVAESTPSRNQSTKNSGLKPIVTKTKHATSIKGMLRSWKAGKRGVYVRVTINSKQEYYPTGYYIDETNFDIGAGLVKGNVHNKEEINSYLRYLINELDGVLSNLKRSDEVISLDNFRRYYSRRVKKDMRFDDYFKAALAEKKQNIEPATVELYTRLLTKLKEYAPDISIRSIDKHFIKDWELWLKREKGLIQNTVNRYLHTLRTFLIKAVEDEVIEVSPFAKIKISHVQGHRDFLAQEELDALMKVQIPEANTGEARAREMFVFCCLTGIRYSDLITLKWSHIRTLTSDMHFTMQKTKFPVTIPLIDQAKEILNRQEKISEFIFKRITNQKLNEHLHTLERRAGIQKSLTVHVARHTFATLSLERGVPIEVVSKVLGHTDLKTTMVYAKITPKTMQKEMQKLNGMFNSMVQSDAIPPADMNSLLTQMHEIMKQMQERQGK